MRAALFLAATLALAGCHKSPPERHGLDALDDQLTGNLADPAMAAALHDQIMADPALAQAGSRDQADLPTAAPAPTPTPTQGARATMRASHDAITHCAGSLKRSADWAGRLPPGVGVYPGAHVGEAAGSDTDGCALRVVSFVTPAAIADVAAWYRAHAADFVVEQRAANGGYAVTGDAPNRAFILYLAPRRGGGTSADLIAEGGR